MTMPPLVSCSPDYYECVCFVSVRVFGWGFSELLSFLKSHVHACMYLLSSSVRSPFHFVPRSDGESNLLRILCFVFKQQQQKKPVAAPSRWAAAETSSSDDEGRVVKSLKDRRWGAMREVIRQMENHMKILDFAELGKGRPVTKSAGLFAIAFLLVSLPFIHFCLVCFFVSLFVLFLCWFFHSC